MRRFADVSFFVIASIVVALASAGGALAQKRVALVIGNAAYEHTARLANPKNDATDIAAALKSHGCTSATGRSPTMGNAYFSMVLRHGARCLALARRIVKQDERDQPIVDSG
jgi:hypothetical protein